MLKSLVYVIPALMLSACDAWQLPDLSSPATGASLPTGQSEPLAADVAIPAEIGSRFGGSVDPMIFTGRANNLPLLGQPFVVNAGDGFVEVVSQNETGLVSVGPIVPIAVEPGKVYVVTAEIMRHADPGETVPTIEAFSLDENGGAFERNWAVKFFGANLAPGGERVTLSARFAVNPPDGSGIVKLAHPEDVRFVRFSVSPNRGTLSGQRSSVYSVEIEVK